MSLILCGAVALELFDDVHRVRVGRLTRKVLVHKLHNLVTREPSSERAGNDSNGKKLKI
jgi:hypothetical protein